MNNHNPLIDGTMPDQTLHNVSSVVSYLQSVQPLDGDVAGPNAETGLYNILACVCSALDFEASRVAALRKGCRS